MSYDLHGSWESKTGHNSPLYAREDEVDGERYLNQVNFALCFNDYVIQRKSYLTITDKWVVNNISDVFVGLCR